MIMLLVGGPLNGRIRTVPEDAQSWLCLGGTTTAMATTLSYVATNAVANTVMYIRHPSPPGYTGPTLFLPMFWGVHRLTVSEGIGSYASTRYRDVAAVTIASLTNRLDEMIQQARGEEISGTRVASSAADLAGDMVVYRATAYAATPPDNVTISSEPRISRRAVVTWTPSNEPTGDIESISGRQLADRWTSIVARQDQYLPRDTESWDYEHTLTWPTDGTYPCQMCWSRNRWPWEPARCSPANVDPLASICKEHTAMIGA